MMDAQKQELFLAILEQHKGLLYKVASSYCPAQADRQDLLQEMTLQLWRAFDHYDANRNLTTWMYRIALNVAISFHRKSQSRTTRERALDDGILLAPEVVNDVGNEVRLSLLQRFINELNDLDKALMLLYLEEKNGREIAEILGITETNVATKIGRIKDKLRQKFAQTDAL
jgi:RNA polymerase sigma-70 factor (ECF subfamily)